MFKPTKEEFQTWLESLNPDAVFGISNLHQNPLKQFVYDIYPQDNFTDVLISFNYITIWKGKEGCVVYRTLKWMKDFQKLRMKWPITPKMLLENLDFIK